MEVCEKLLLTSSRIKQEYDFPPSICKLLIFCEKTFRASTRKLKSNINNFFMKCKVWFTTSQINYSTSHLAILGSQTFA